VVATLSGATQHGASFASLGTAHRQKAGAAFCDPAFFVKAPAGKARPQADETSTFRFSLGFAKQA
jgi:hypothetical protein